MLFLLIHEFFFKYHRTLKLLNVFAALGTFYPDPGDDRDRIYRLLGDSDHCCHYHDSF